jgi:hypothetical protein
VEDAGVDPDALLVGTHFGRVARFLLGTSLPWNQSPDPDHWMPTPHRPGVPHASPWFPALASTAVMLNRANLPGALGRLRPNSVSDARSSWSGTAYRFVRRDGERLPVAPHVPAVYVSPLRLTGRAPSRSRLPWLRAAIVLGRRSGSETQLWLLPGHLVEVMVGAECMHSVYRVSSRSASFWIRPSTHPQVRVAGGRNSPGTERWSNRAATLTRPPTTSRARTTSPTADQPRPAEYETVDRRPDRH